MDLDVAVADESEPQGSEGDRLFKVSRSILAAKPPNSELIDGCPVVNLHDSSSDTTKFLKVMFHYEVIEPFPAEVDFPTVSGVLRLSNKYQVDIIRKRALRHLSERYWDHDISWNQNPADAIILARTLKSGVLSLPDIHVCLQALSTLHVRNSSVLKFLLEPITIADCVSPLQCLEKRMKARAHWEDWDDLHVCKQCQPILKQTHAASVERFWSALPGIFGLPYWETLETMKHVAFD
ncbi:hypothetical protein C8J57DRAFT_1518422 [Mycena rebaudengoi]|nr:hypothetical protein C8J57DRAFT_1518422 [Mycena rebaudengoi]